MSEQGLELHNGKGVLVGRHSTDEYLKKMKIILNENEELRKLLATSVAKECKCEVNTSVNHDLVERNLEMKAILNGFLTTKECRVTWIEEMHCTIDAVLNGEM